MGTVPIFRRKMGLSPFGVPLAVFTPVLLILSYPKANLDFLAWIALAPLTIAILRAKNPGRAAGIGFLSGTIFHLGLLYWIYSTCRAGGVSVFFSGAAWIALSAVLALEWTVFAWAAKWLARAGPAFPLAAAMAWTAVEWAKTVLASKAVWFPWFCLGYTQWKHPVLLQIVSVTGTWGLSFAIALTGISLGYAFWKGGCPSFSKKTACFAGVPMLLRRMAGVFAVLIIILSYGILKLKTDGHSGAGRVLKVSILQPNIDHYKKWDEKYVTWIEARLTRLLEEASRSSPHLVIWPESALPGWIEEKKYKTWLQTLASDMKAFHLVGSVSEEGGRHVSAFLFDRQGHVTGVYNKRQLVPFGEYVPMRALLGKWITAIGKLGEFDPGGRQQKPLSVDDFSMGVSICYESIFPGLLRENVSGGADFLVNITNDGWYLDTAGPYQHFLVNVFRAVENRRPLVRVGNTGVSAWIDQCGRIHDSTDLNTHGVITFDLPLTGNQPKTLYTRRGNWFAQLCAAATLAFLLAAIIL